MSEMFNNNEENQYNANINEETTSAGIPAMVQPRKQKANKGKVALLTAAVALASFGAGSLYTSYSWIEGQGSNQSSALDAPSQMTQNNSGANISQTAATLSTDALSVAQVAHQAADSVVEITTEVMATDMFMRQYVTEGAGSGVVISSDGYIATNNHVIEGASKITVRLTNGEEYEAKLIGTDAQTDVAVLKVEGVTLQPITFGDSDSLVVGDTAIAIGNPLGQLGGTVTDGIISALDREIELESQKMTLLQTNAAINPGNSGGGLFNSKGELIGLVVAKSAGSNVEGLGFAIPSNVVKEVVQSIIDVGYVQGRPVLGISAIDINSWERAYQYGLSQLGVYVGELTSGTKAEASGLKVGDCIVAVEDTQIQSASDLKKNLQQYKVGDKVKVVISRNGKLIELQVELSESVPTPAEEVAPSGN